MTVSASPRTAWVITECYPRPDALQHCVFAHRQLVGLQSAGWRTRVLVPGPSYPRWLWPVAKRWREARRRTIPRGWAHEGMAVTTLAYANPIPHRLANGTIGELVRRALDGEVAASANTEEPSVLLCQFALPFGPIVRSVAQKHRRPYAVVLRGDDVWIWPHASPEGLAGFIATVQDAALVLAVSEAILTEARRLSGLELPRAAVLPNGVDLDRLRPMSSEARRRARATLGISEEAYVILCVAAAIARKGWRELLDAVGAMNTSGIVVLAASTGSGELDLQAEQSRRCPSSALVLRESLTTTELSLLYGAADVFCLPTYGEGMSNALLEAMAAGLPVITTPVGGHPEVITPEVEGFLVAPRAVEPLVEALTRCRDHADLRGQMGAAARRRVERVGTPTDNGRRLAHLLDGILDPTLESVLTVTNPYQSLSAAMA
jgi:glycosyltransferase involved in cell wall biosynthesis